MINEKLRFGKLFLSCIAMICRYFGVISIVFASNVAVAEEKFLSCVLQRMQMSGLAELDTTDVSKAEEPLIRIDANGDFWVYVGNQYSETLFPEGIQIDFVGKPNLPNENIYRWTQSTYSKVRGMEVVVDWTFSLSRDELRLIKSREEDLRALGMPNGRHVWTHECRLVEKEVFERFKADMSAKYMKLNAEEQEEARQRESNRKI